MGLDFSIYKKKKGANNIHWYDEDELCYGRKSWELVHVLVPNYVEEYDALLDPNRWEKLIKLMEPIGDKLNDIVAAYHIMYNLPEHFPEQVFTDREQKLIAEYELWYNSTFEDDPTLGYDFSAGYMLDFWRARDMVRKYLQDPNYEVYALVSY